MSELLVCESKPLNAAVLAQKTDLELREVRSLEQLEVAIRQDDPLVVAIEIRLANLASSLEIVRRIKATTRAAVLAMPWPDVEPFTAELLAAGVDLVFWSMLDRTRAASFIDRKVQVEARRNVQGTGLTLEQRIWSRLPWKRHATGGSSRDKKRNNGQGSHGCGAGQSEARDHTREFDSERDRE